MTRWQIKGSIHDAYELLSNPARYPTWWKGVPLSAQELDEEKEGGPKPLRLEMRGWLPYTLRWELINPQFDRPHQIISDSRGDFVGRGVWTLKQDGPYVLISFEWRVSVQKPFLRYFSFLLRPLFIWNHNWVMEKWKKSLELELKKGIKNKRLSL